MNDRSNELMIGEGEINLPVCVFSKPLYSQH